MSHSIKSIRIHGIGMTSQRTRERLVKRLEEVGIRDSRVLEVMRRTPRHLFVDEALASRAYEDTALPIGFGQTISQPYVVARMTEAVLADRRVDRALEIGTGSGYQTAVLAQLVERIYSVERIAALSDSARVRLVELQLHRKVRLKHSDGSWGWPEHGPYDAVLVTAAPAKIPDVLFDQLAEGGRMVIPVGTGWSQELLLITRIGNVYVQTPLGPVSFVPLQQGAC